MTIRPAAPGELDWINQCYAAIDFRLSTAHDLQAVAEVGGARAGLGRIVPIEARIGELGGMLVFDAWRGTGLSKEIIAFLTASRDYDYLYCLPFARLEGLYAAFGFRRVAATAAMPAKVLEKYRWCAQFYPEPVLLMGRALSAPPSAAAPPSW